MISDEEKIFNRIKVLHDNLLIEIEPSIKKRTAYYVQSFKKLSIHILANNREEAKITKLQAEFEREIQKEEQKSELSNFSGKLTYSTSSESIADEESIEKIDKDECLANRFDELFNLTLDKSISSLCSTANDVSSISLSESCEEICDLNKFNFIMSTLKGKETSGYLNESDSYLLESDRNGSTSKSSIELLEVNEQLTSSATNNQSNKVFDFNDWTC